MDVIFYIMYSEKGKTLSFHNNYKLNKKKHASKSNIGIYFYLL